MMAFSTARKLLCDRAYPCSVQTEARTNANGIGVGQSGPSIRLRPGGLDCYPVNCSKGPDSKEICHEERYVSGLQHLAQRLPTPASLRILGSAVRMSRNSIRFILLQILVVKSRTAAKPTDDMALEGTLENGELRGCC